MTTNGQNGHAAASGQAASAQPVKLRTIRSACSPSLTHRCPLGCPYCSNPLEMDKREGELDTATWARVFTEAAGLGVLQVHLSGGEPASRRRSRRHHGSGAQRRPLHPI